MTMATIRRIDWLSAEEFAARTDPPPTREELETRIAERAARDLADLLDVADEDPDKANEDVDRLDVYRARAALKLATQALAHWQSTAAVRDQAAWSRGYDAGHRSLEGPA